ncbi:hypothetical protein D5H75_19260 [Bailinhaonella thermotolerans]|uniref:DUF2567 domain-containing protein n=1 Tax=Bailinhaonella thermotolerans TaxID=1070861 RepID=A0A3A4AT36_9ACTN|nr:hypothetical protein D5H75_19260 [Bailinhaonella thermotolerans]
MRQARAFGVTMITLTLLGTVAGPLWAWAAPRPPYVVTRSGPVLADPGTQTLIAADGWFAAITGLAGLVCGLVAYRLSERPVAVLLGLTAGGLLAAFVAYWLGQWVDQATVRRATALGAQIPGPLDLRATGVLLSWSLLSVITFGALESLAAYRASRRRKPYGIEDETP